jgi:hypothetical protein
MSMEEVDFHNEMVAGLDPRPSDKVNFARARMTRFYTYTRYFQPTDPALNYVICGDSGAGASKALFNTFHVKASEQKN